MGLLALLECEESVGRLWHRLVEAPPSWPDFPEAAVRLDDIRGGLAVFFRGLGGAHGLRLGAAAARQSDHRLTVRQRLGLERERLTQARCDSQALSLPPRIAFFAERRHNRALYFWLAAFFAASEPLAPESDPLRRDLRAIAAARRTSLRVIERCPGLARDHAALAAALRAVRPRRRLEGIEAQVEALVLEALGGPAAGPLAAIGGGAAPRAPSSYRPFLPVPLWGEHLAVGAAALSGAPAGGEEGGGGGDDDGRRRPAERKAERKAERDDPLILNRFEKILALAEMTDVERDLDDADADEARRAADEQDGLRLSPHSRKASTRLKFDLDLPPAAVDPARLEGSWLYPEWDWRKAAHLPDHCAVTAAAAEEEGEGWVPDAALERRIRAVRRQFEALRSRPVALPARPDGGEIDLDAAVRARSDLAACGEGSGDVWIERRFALRDLAVLLLVDRSLSTDSWSGGRRVLDVEKEALAVFCAGLDGSGDDFAVQSFTSRTRHFVRIETLKDFGERFGPAVLRRIGAMRPGFYTRIGAAVRHAGAQLEARPNRHRLLLVLTDGKPNDLDHYEGRHGAEDTRKALQEVRAKGIAAFGITVDRTAQAYFPYLFGPGRFAIVQDLAQLSRALPRLYRHLSEN